VLLISLSGCGGPDQGGPSRGCPRIRANRPRRRSRLPPPTRTYGATYDGTPSERVLDLGVVDDPLDVPGACAEYRCCTTL